MESHQVQASLNSLWEGKVDQHTVDLLSHTISFQLIRIENGVVERHSLVFSGVTSTYYVAEKGERRHNIWYPDEGDFLELTSIHYYEKGIGNIVPSIATDSWLRGYSLSANFALEIWNSLLLIEAKMVSIDGASIELEYPEA